MVVTFVSRWDLQADRQLGAQCGFQAVSVYTHLSIGMRILDNLGRLQVCILRGREKSGSQQ